MSERTQTIYIKIPLTSAEKACLDNLPSTYKRACQYVSKYVYKTRILNQRQILKALYDYLNDTFHINRCMAQTIIRTVVEEYKKSKRWRYLRLKWKYTPRWKHDYLLTDDKFYINLLNGKIQHTPLTYDEYFGICAIYQFGDGELINKWGTYYLKIPFTFEIDGCGKWEERFVLTYLKHLWRKMKRKGLFS